MTDLDIVARHDLRIGEGPLWHPDEEVLYWVEIKSGRLFSYDPKTGESRQRLELDTTLGGFTIQADASLLLFLGEGAVATWDGEDIEYVIRAIPEERNTRFNDVIAGPGGRVYAGTMPTDDKLGRLYRFNPEGSYERVDDRGYDVPNGMGFTPDREALYVTESMAHTIHLFDYDHKTGELSNRRPFVEVPTEDQGLPDGMTVDAEGTVWSARWDGHRIIRYDPNGREIGHLDSPVPKPSCVTFGGPDYETLYVTTAKGHQAEDAPPAGSLFRSEPGVAGVPEFRSRVGLE